MERIILDELIMNWLDWKLLNDSKILKDSSAKYVLWDMLRPEVQQELRAELKEELRPKLQEKVRAELREELRAEEARSLLVGLATDRFGAPTELQKALLDGIGDHDRLVRLCKKIGSLSTWEELLASESAP